MREARCRLPRLISDGMVLQRGDSVRIWGWAAPGEKVTVNFIDHNYQATADASGEWAVWLSGLKPGGPLQHEDRGNQYYYGK